MLVFYLAALAVLFVSAFWSIDSFTGKLTHTWTWENFHAIVSDPTYREIAWRTIWMAAAVTVTDAVIAFPFAYYMARISTPRLRTVLFVLVLLPLWSARIPCESSSSFVPSWSFHVEGVLGTPLEAHPPAPGLDHLGRRGFEVLLHDRQLAPGVELDDVPREHADVDDVANAPGLAGAVLA